MKPRFINTCAIIAGLWLAIVFAVPPAGHAREPVPNYDSQGYVSDHADLPIAWQRGVVMDAKSSGRLELGLVVVTDTALGHQPGGFMGEAMAAFPGACLGMLARMVHGQSPVDSCRE